MNVLVDRMVEQGLIDESAARGVLGLLAKGELPTRAFLASGLAEDAMLRFLASSNAPTWNSINARFQRSFLPSFLLAFFWTSMLYLSIEAMEICLPS